MKLYSFVNNSRVLPLATLSNRYIQTVEQSGIPEAAQSVQFDQLVELNNKYQAAIDPKRVNEISVAIDLEFNNREALFTQMHTYLHGLTLSPDAAVRTAAIALFAAIDKYGTSFNRRPLGEQSVYYIRIIEAIKNPAFASAINQAHLSEQVAKFEASQLNYESLYIGRGNAKQKSTAPSSLRKELQQCLKKHLAEVESMAGRTGDDAWKQLCNELKQRFTETQTPMNKRRPDIPKSATTDAANQPA
jgi:hypothetical protein